MEKQRSRSQDNEAVKTLTEPRPLRRARSSFSLEGVKAPSEKSKSSRASQLLKGLRRGLSIKSSREKQQDAQEAQQDVSVSEASISEYDAVFRAGRIGLQVDIRKFIFLDADIMDSTVNN